MVMGSLTEEAEVAIIGGGPGGYVAAIRAADLGKEVVLIEEREKLGGVCLIEGCIPSKALINAVEIADAARNASQLGITFGDVSLDIAKLREWTQGVVDTLTGGVAGLLKRRGVEVIKGRATFESNNKLRLEGSDISAIEFRKAIIASGSRVNRLPMAKDLPVWTSMEALQLERVPEHMVIVGGGYIGLELGLVYAGLGSKITVVEFLPHLLTGADQDLTQVVLRHCEKKFEAIHVDSKVTGIEKSSAGYVLTYDYNGETKKIETDQVLTAIGRKPNSDTIGLENTDVKLNERGFIAVNEEMQTNVPHIYAIGDVVPGPALAHKASREGKVAAEVIANHKSAFDNRAIPAVVFTDPEIAWSGWTEHEAKQAGIEYKVGRFPLTALGRARAIGKTDGFVKILSSPKDNLILGIGIVGHNASELIAEGTLAIEMGGTLEDLLVTIHPHPTLSESIMEAAEVAAGEPIHIDKR